ncbi:MAG: FHA domain-containing protein [Clostridia bacterium]|nr:FHA domain-containing protein [Clostridia bacterium]
MSSFEYSMRYILCILAIAVIINCVWSLIRLRPDKKVYAILLNMANDEQHPITCYETSIGRSKSCDIVFTNSTVSRSHAVVALRKDGFYVFDTESKAGVYVNGEKIQKSEKLSDGDIIAFGTAIMKFYMGSEANNDISHKKEETTKISRLVNLADNTEFDLDGDFVTIGREKGSNIEIPAPYVSRRQAEIFKYNNNWYIKNFGKVTKTTLNGDPIFSDTPLYGGDVIRIGDFEFLYEEN